MGKARLRKVGPARFEKLCSRCGLWLAVERFHRRPGTACGLRSVCRDCERELNRQRRAVARGRCLSRPACHVAGARRASKPRTKPKPVSAYAARVPKERWADYCVDYSSALSVGCRSTYREKSVRKVSNKRLSEIAKRRPRNFLGQFVAIPVPDPDPPTRLSHPLETAAHVETQVEGDFRQTRIFPASNTDPSPPPASS